MSTQISTTVTASPTSSDTSTSRSRAFTIALWTVQILVAAALFFSAVMKLTGAEEMVALFDAIGIGHWFRYVTAGIQFVGAVLLVVPRIAPFGALLLASTMGGAVLTHLFVIGGSALVPLVLFVLLLGIAWGHRAHVTNLIGRYQIG